MDEWVGKRVNNSEPSVATQEVWRVCKYSRNYFVSDQGRVKRRTKGHGTHTGRLVNASLSNGFLRLKLWENGTSKQVYLHRLVALMFKQCPHEMEMPWYEVTHLDPNPYNNAASNLAIISRRANFRRSKGSRRFGPGELKSLGIL